MTERQARAFAKPMMSGNDILDHWDEFTVERKVPGGVLVTILTVNR